MKKISLLIAAWIFAAPAWTATPEDLDQLLTKIEQDISEMRLSTPANNNALDKIESFREAAPFDFRVVPLAYQWGEAYVGLARQALAKGKYEQAQEYLDKVWPVAALTPGLEDAQRAIDEARAAGSAPVAAVEEEAVSRAELERQRKLAEAAAREKERLKVEAEKQKQAEAARRAEEARKAAAEKALREQQERERRAALAAAKKQEAARQKSPVDIDDIALDILEPAAPAKPAPVVRVQKPAPVVKPKREVAATPLAKTTQLWAGAREESAPIARYDVPAPALSSKDRGIADQMGDICQKMVDEDASVVIHTDSKSDYRWLAVRLTLCGRRIDRGYRLRHSHEPLAAGETPNVTLHPPRTSSLVEEVSG
ncbi:hypothetical protein [Thalassolituus sp.]|jgi:colicin import membrane protein|uniref:hypothetical protein n=1 Tax=Thalassolituus sp. TaxID=2030822 RepID=UPI00351713EF|nr:MAG: hypothetical protein CSH36_01580 [Thalassolituus sp.]